MSLSCDYSEYRPNYCTIECGGRHQSKLKGPSFRFLLLCCGGGGRDSDVLPLNLLIRRWNRNSRPTLSQG